MNSSLSCPSYFPKLAVLHQQPKHYLANMGRCSAIFVFGLLGNIIPISELTENNILRMQKERWVRYMAPQKMDGDIILSVLLDNTIKSQHLNQL